MPMSVTDARQPDNPLAFVNDAFLRLTGYDRSEVIGRNHRFLQGEDTDPMAVAALRTAIDAGEPIEIDVLNYRKDGSSFWNRLLISPLLGADGEPAYFTASQYDVTFERELVALRARNEVLAAENAQRSDALVESEAQLRLALGVGRLGVFELDLKTERLTASDRTRAHFGRPPDGPFTMEDVRSAIHADDRPGLRAAFDEAAAAGTELDHEYRVPRGDGLPGWLHVRALVLPGPDGQPGRLLGTSADVTERRHRTEALRENEERLRVALEAGEFGTWELDPDTDIAICSPRHHAILGYPTLSGTWSFADFRRHVVPDDVPKVVGAFDRAARFGEPLGLRVRIRRADNGEIRWIDMRGLAMQRADVGRPRMTGVVADVTDEVAAEAARRQLTELLEVRVAARTRERDSLWQASRDLLVVLGTDGVIVAANPAWTRLLGWTEDDLIGHDFTEYLFDPETSSPAGIGSRRHLETRYRHRDGSMRWIEWTASPADDHIIAVGRDVTEQHEAAAQLQAAEETLRQAQKMEAVGQLTGGIAHDFNNLLTGIMGALELIGTRVGQGRTGDLDRYIGAARQGAERAAALTHRLLAFSRQQTLDPKPVLAGRLIGGMEELIRRTIGPAITLTVAIEEGLWTTLCDPNQLENALLNLCINARDAMADGGRLTIEARNVPVGAKTGPAHDGPPGDHVCVAVTDTGTGMTPEIVARAFDPFFTTKPIGRGTGLGLSMTYGFARQSGGEVRIHSHVGLGTSVRVYLPRRDAGAPADVMAGNGGTERDRPIRGTVLVVDDEAAIRELIVEVLEERGFATLSASDGVEALRLLHSQARIDLLVTDVGLPAALNGRQLADAARVRRPELRVLFITGYAEAAAFGHGVLEPGLAVLGKPFSMEALAGRVTEMLNLAG